ncbi:MAG: PAS domain-containing protein, partial [Chloroflexota bacterium]
LGVMLISTKTRNILNENDRRFIQSIGDQLAIGIENQTLLAESQFERQRLQNILETLPVGVMVLDPDTLIPISANQQVEELLGQPLNMEEPFTAERYHIRRTGTNLEYPTNELPMYKAREQGKRIRPADDLAIITEFDRTDLLISAAPIFDPSGESRAIVVSLSDVTPMRSMENTMQENLRETVLLYETQRAMNESEDLEQLLDSLVAQMVMQQPTDTYIVLQNEGKIELARSMMMPIENIEALRPILLPELVNVDDVGRDTTALPYETRQAFIQVNARSVLAVPLAVRTRPEPMGWIIITDEAPEAFTFDQERTMSSVADMASQAIDNRYLIERTQAALDETEALYTANEV